MKRFQTTFFTTILFAFGLCLWVGTSYSYPEYQEFPPSELKGDGSYLDFASKIDASLVQSIFEIGSRDARDAVELSQFFKSHVFAFECNPAAVEICVQNLGDNPNVTLIPCGVWNVQGEMPFYRVVDKNIGASSFFQFNPEARNYPDIVEEGLVQEEIIVLCVRLDNFMTEHQIEKIDLLCMDVQGAAYQVLQSLGDQLSQISYIVVELETHPIYSGEVLFEDVDKYLTENGFARGSDPLDSMGLFGDMLYINSKIINCLTDQSKL
jgi:FkbM family methyltransferase